MDMENAHNRIQKNSEKDTLKLSWYNSTLLYDENIHIVGKIPLSLRTEGVLYSCSTTDTVFIFVQIVGNTILYSKNPNLCFLDLLKAVSKISTFYGK